MCIISCSLACMFWSWQHKNIYALQFLNMYLFYMKLCPITFNCVWGVSKYKRGLNECLNERWQTLVPKTFYCYKKTDTIQNIQNVSLKQQQRMKQLNHACNYCDFTFNIQDVSVDLQSSSVMVSSRRVDWMKDNWTRWIVEDVLSLHHTASSGLTWGGVSALRQCSPRSSVLVWIHMWTVVKLRVRVSAENRQRC